MRMLRCDIISVPKNPVKELKNVWVGTDFSKESKKVFSLTQLLQKQNNSKITAAHIYSVPIQFAPYLKKEEMVPKIEEHIREKFERFLSKLEMSDIQPAIIRGREASVSQKLADEAAKSKADLLVVSDKGGNAFSSLMVGSVTDELFSSHLRMPLWVVK